MEFADDEGEGDGAQEMAGGGEDQEPFHRRGVQDEQEQELEEETQKDERADDFRARFEDDQRNSAGVRLDDALGDRFRCVEAGGANVACAHAVRDVDGEAEAGNEDLEQRSRSD